MSGSTNFGFGLGFRPKHHAALLRAPATSVDWLEIVSENYMGAGGRPRRLLKEMRERYPLVMHGVGLSIAGTDPLDERYLESLKDLADWIQPRLLSDHLCWTSHRGTNSHDLLPVAYTHETLRHVAERVRRVQDVLGRRLYLENPSAYVSFANSDMSEADFLAELCKMSGCGLLLDVNNLYVNSRNLGMGAASYLARLDPETIGYFHLAGHTVRPDVRVDTHDEPVPDDVWAVYRDAVRRFPDVATMVEWDDRLPEFPVLVAELDKARAAHAEAVATPTKREVTEVGLQVSTPSRSDAGSWQNVQDRFFAMVTSRQSVDGDASSPHASALANLATGLPAAALVGVNVYADAYHLRITDIARESYPALANVLGRTAFDAMLLAYLEAHPSRDPSIKYATDRLPKFLTAYELPGFGVPKRVLADIAALEQAMEYVFDAPDCPAPLGVGILEEIAPDAWDSIGFEFILALNVVHAEYDVATVVDAVADGLAPERPSASPVAYAVFRADEEVERRTLTAEEGRALELLASGLSFRETVEQLAAGHEEGDPELVERLVAGLVRWISWGLVHGIR